MAKSSLSIFLCSTIILCFSQCHNGIVKSYGYRQASFPGNIPVEGFRDKIVDTLYKVFIESEADTKFDWISAVVGNRSYKIIETSMKTPVYVGLLQNSPDTVFLTTNGTNKMWQLFLEETKDIPTKNGVSLAMPNAILLKGKLGEKMFSYTVKPLQTLQPEMHP